MTYIVEKIPVRQFNARLAKMATTGERLVTFCYLPTVQYQLVIEPPREAQEATKRPRGTGQQ